ncbi:MAG TPA: DJ-1/PfpI family protein [Candidatus Competibacteraceae bacterium]|nr:DJ-1/PfpI family protein [Candidatus Competibacteraceae bacterium]
MNDWPLQGKKIAVLVESEFIPGEIEGYRYGFETLGAEVHFMSRLWGQPSQTFVSDVEHPGETAQTLTVTIDFQNVRLEDYAAVLMAANYTSVRLRYYEPPADQALMADGVTTAPAVQFFAAAMANPRIIKGALCHGLWILTPHPELLKGRRVICHQVVLADIRNCGAEFVAPDQNNGGVMVDRDLVTGHDWHVTRPYVQAIARQITTVQ